MVGGMSNKMGLILLGAIMYYFSDYFAILGAIFVIRTLITTAYNAYPFWTPAVNGFTEETTEVIVCGSKLFLLLFLYIYVPLFNFSGS